ncbi:MAG: hypothetical protein R2750_01225 [Bacteroidales bacterium]
MHIYKFRMLSGENDDFVRDIEIQASQTFKHFHDIINDCIVMKGNELASFHICDQKWNKNTEITLIDMLEGKAMTKKSESLRKHTLCMSQKLVTLSMNRTSDYCMNTTSLI